MQGAEPAAGVLYLVGTPIGNVGDLSPRARHVLGHVQRIACEDTRHSGLLLHNLGLRSGDQAPRLVSFHEHNQTARIPELLEALEAGDAIAVISDAGLPGISDPGEALVAAARAAGRTVICVPGPCAVTTALVSSGLPAGRFCFEGFLPPKSTQRRARLQELATEPRTLVLFEAPHRLLQLLEDLLAELGDRPIAVTRELTKRHEQQIGPSVSAALAHFRQQAPQGEFTIVLGGAATETAPPRSEADLHAALSALVASGLSRSDAARQLAHETGMARRELYALLHRAEEPS
ncbi:16S rRNA (cytidine(1402)-2'-O)-methyltransferase [Synechococcus sp. HK05]|uniref:16S rRNA (cytidine(1402)-2'-O)-methyltransferase n=1 Tax=Synechococcus sp. HK05 TaxID=2725975 RepID=UPI001C3949DF|nr:16S rRNA (cytidine(1402)-2'-O)-methyltransferase [Synechococcus sp. HK05]MBV2351491.1 16S rRNA (cytidine(1402)-2'-O)-methyltransferase [Synechococcus sp. HK05]